MEVEAMPVTAVLLTIPARFRGRDAFWFIDNVAALSGFIRGNSGASDVDRAATVVAILAALSQTRVWFEYVRVKVFPFRDSYVLVSTLYPSRVCQYVPDRRTTIHSAYPSRLLCVNGGMPGVHGTVREQLGRLSVEEVA